MKHMMRLALLSVLVCGASAGAAESTLDMRSVEKDFGVTFEPGAALHGRLVTLNSVGGFELGAGRCIVAVRKEEPTEAVEILHREALFDTKAYSVTQHTFVLVHDSARNVYFVMDVVVREAWSTRDPIFGAFGPARQVHQVYATRLSQALGMSARCLPSMAKVKTMLEALPAAFR